MKYFPPDNVKKKVIFFTYHFPLPSESGSFRPWTEAKILSDLGFEVKVITSGRNYLSGKSLLKRGLFGKERVGNIEIFRFWSLPQYRKCPLTRLLGYFLYGVCAFWVAIFLPRPDKILVGTSSYFITYFFYFYRILKSRKIDFVVDERDLLVETAENLGIITNKAIIALLKKWDRFFRRKATWVMTVNERMKKILIEKSGVSPGKIKVVYNVDIDLLHNGELNLHSRDKFLEKEKFVVLYAGGMGMISDIPTILKAALLVKENNPNVLFVLLGDGERRRHYDRFISRNRLSNVRIISAVSRQEARKYIASADLCIHAVRNNEFWNVVLPSKIFDYLLLKKAVVFCGRGEVASFLTRASA
ncbi:MAG: hypothetical protein DRN08_06500, partial [Thermoplasmata archaeon]